MIGAHSNHRQATLRVENKVSNEEQVSPEIDQQQDSAAEESVQAEAAEQAGTSPEARIEALEEELSKTKDEALRTMAEAHNIRRRSEAEVEKARKFALEKFAGELLAVVDNLERAIDAADAGNEAVKPLLEGVALTQKSLVETLGRFNVQQLNPVGEPFDPQFHQAMSMVENPDVEPNTVTVVMQKGYTLNDRLLRPAMVMVSKAASPSVDEQA